MRPRERITTIRALSPSWVELTCTYKEWSAERLGHSATAGGLITHVCGKEMPLAVHRGFAGCARCKEHDFFHVPVVSRIWFRAFHIIINTTITFIRGRRCISWTRFKINPAPAAGLPAT
jgi:hypothetical protein